MSFLLLAALEVLEVLSLCTRGGRDRLVPGWNSRTSWPVTRA